MPIKIPVAQRQQRLAPLPKFRQSESAPHIDALGAVARGVSDVGRAAQVVGDAFEKIKREQNIAQLNDLKGQLTMTRIRLFEDKDNGLGVQKNKNAIDNAQKFLDDFDEFGKGLRDGIASEDVKKSFDEVMVAQQFKFKRRVNKHVAAESRSLSLSNVKSALSSHAADAVSAGLDSDFDGIFAAMAESEATVLVFAEATDMPNGQRDVQIEAERTIDAIGAINAMIQKGHLGAARLFLDGDPRDDKDEGVRDSLNAEMVLMSKVDKVLTATTKEHVGIAAGNEAFAKFGSNTRKGAAHLRAKVTDPVELNKALRTYETVLKAAETFEYLSDRSSLDTLKARFLDNKGTGFGLPMFERMNVSSRADYRDFVRIRQGSRRAEVNASNEIAIRRFRARSIDRRASSVVEEEKWMRNLDGPTQDEIRELINKAKIVSTSKQLKIVQAHVRAIAATKKWTPLQTKRAVTGVTELFHDQFDPNGKPATVDDANDFILRLGSQARPDSGVSTLFTGERKFFVDKETILKKLSQAGELQNFVDADAISLDQLELVSSEPGSSEPAVVEPAPRREEALDLLKKQGLHDPTEEQVVAAITFLTERNK